MPKNLIKRNTTWWYRFTYAGKLYQGSLGTDQLQIAKDRLEKFKQELNQTKYGEKPRRTFDEASVRFAEEHYKTLKPKSRLRYAVSFDALVDHFKGKYLDEIGSALLGNFERARLSTGVTTSTVRRDLACLSSVFSRAEEWEWTSYNPVKPYLRGRTKAGLRENDPRTRWLTIDEEKVLIENSTGTAKDFFQFAIDTGLRKEEMFSLLISDVDLKANQLTVRKEVSKNHKARTIPLLPRAREIFIRLKGSRIGAQPVFTTYDGHRYSNVSPSMYKALQRACARAGLLHTSLHDLRRTCGCRLLQDYNLSMEQVSAWLGHSSIRVTETRYAFLQVDNLHKALKKIQMR